MHEAVAVTLQAAYGKEPEQPCHGYNRYIWVEVAAGDGEIGCKKKS